MQHVSSSFSPTQQTRPRCFLCKRKLNLVEQNAGLCKCNQVFCAKHRCVQTNGCTKDQCHPCSFDYLSEQKQLLTQQNPVIKFEKIKMV